MNWKKFIGSCLEFLRIPDTNVSVSVEYEETGNLKRDVIEKEQLRNSYKKNLNSLM